MGLMINDVDLKTTYKFVTTDVNGRGAPPVERSTLEDLSFDGAIELGTKLAKRDISITGYVYGTSPSDARTNKDNLISFVSQGYTDEVKITFPDTNRSIYAKLAGTPIVWQAQGPTLNAVAYSVTMNFVALDPYFYGSDFSATGSNASGMIKLSTEAPLYLVDPRRSLYKREPKLKVYPVTVVNLLGKYGDFETDSNSDGLADGWRQYSQHYESITTTNIMDGIQYVERTLASPATIYLNCRLSSSVQTNNYVFARRKIKTQTSAPTHGGLGAMLFYLPEITTVLFYGAIHNDFTHQYTSAKMPTTYDFVYLYLTQEFAGAQAGTYKMWIDNVILVNLTRMGVLPPPLKEYFNNVPSTWADLATSSNIAAIDGKVQSGNAWLNDLLPYVNGVGTLGYTWGA